MIAGFHVPRGHDFINLGRGLHGHHNLVFTLFLNLYGITQKKPFDLINPTIWSNCPPPKNEPLSEGPLILQLIYRSR